MEDGGPPGAAAGILEAGTRLGKYEVGRLIGLGSMSAIYEGARPDTGRRVAIKVLSPTRAGVPGARARFLTEAKLTARVRHAHIVDVLEVAEDGELSYLVMEMLEGEDLARRLRLSSFLSAAETAEILVPVCEAVAAAHECGVVHRDLKPANIFLAIRDQKVHPIVLDFGIANETDDEAGAGAGPRLVFGTPYYLSPEQIADHRAATPASDQWALGIILYECLTGARPFDGDSLQEVFAAIGAGKAVPPSERRPGISPALEQVVRRAMSSDPRARFASVTELAQALRPFRPGAGEVRAPARRRAPSSPAIVAEASTQSPFLRTLTPEVDVLDGLWFEPDPTEETSGDVTLPPVSLSSLKASIADASGAESSIGDAARPLSSEAWPTFANRWTERWRSVSERRVTARRIGAAAGGALGGLVILFLIARGGSAHRQGPQGAAKVKAAAIEQSAGAAAVPSAEKEPPTASAPPREREQESPSANEPAVAKEPAVASSLSVAPAVKEPTAVKEPVAAKEPTVKPIVKPPVTPAAIRSASAERRVRTASAPTEASRATGSATRETAERPRVRTSPEVRMHNGVPLLD